MVVQLQFDNRIMKLIIIHDNTAWIQRLKTTCQEAGFEVEEWEISSEIQDSLLQSLATEVPPDAIYLNRISSSSHYRKGRFAIEYVKQILAWLHSHNKTVINGISALEIEISKFYQYQELTKVGLSYPKTYLCCNNNQLRRIVNDKFKGNCLVKDNRSGSGLSVERIETESQLDQLVDTEFSPVDGIKLVQQYVKPLDNCIYRLEFVDYRLVYAVRVKDVGYNFNLCPADRCHLSGNKFEIIKDFHQDPRWTHLVSKLSELCLHNRISIAGIEFLLDQNQQIYVYDINTNTNYNSSAEKKANLVNHGNQCIVNMLMETLNLETTS